MRKFSALALSAAMLSATSANAAQTFVLTDVAFADGASITGSFTTDDTLTLVTDWLVTTGPGTGTGFFGVPATTSGSTYAPAPPILGPAFGTATLTSTGITFVDGILIASSLTLNFGAPLSSAGTTISGGSERFGLFGLRTVAAGGTLVSNTTPAVPEPATWGLMILGMGAVGFAMRRREKVRTRVSYAA